MNSGLRNPAAAVRGVGAGALGVQAVVLLLTVVPLTKLGGPYRGAAIGVTVGLAVVAVVLAGLLGRRWAWHAGWAIPVALLASAWLHWTLAALGVLFALVWAYVLHVRRTVLSGAAPSG